MSELTQHNATNSSSDYYGYYYYFDPVPEDTLWVILEVFLYWGGYILAVLSLFGNILVMVVMSRSWICKSSTSVFFTALALMDIAVCVIPVVNLALGYIYENVRVDVTVAIALSQLQIILTGIAHKTSHSLLCLITVERVLSVYIPHKIKLICTFHISKVAVISIVLFFLVTEPIMYSIAVEFYVNGVFTYQERFQNGVLLLNIMYAVFSFFIPILVTLTGTILIIIKLNARNRLMTQQDESSKRKARTSNSITRTLLAANLAFILLQVPYGFLTIAEDCIWPYNDPNRPLTESTLVLMYAFAFLSQLNSGINFFLYVLSGSRFREEVTKLLCRSACCRKPTQQQE